MWSLGILPSNPFWWLFLWIQVISTHSCIDQNSSDDLRGTLCRSSEVYLLSDSLPCELTSVSQHPLPCFPLTVLCLGNFLQSVNWENSRAHLVFFPCLLGFIFLHCLVINILNITVSYIFVWFSNCLRWHGKFCPCCSIFAGSRNLMYLHLFHL